MESWRFLRRLRFFFRKGGKISAASPLFSGLLDPILLIQASITQPSTFSERRGIHEYLIGKLKPAGVRGAEKPPGHRESRTRCAALAFKALTLFTFFTVLPLEN
jgi:hypothetical protein